MAALDLDARVAALRAAFDSAFARAPLDGDDGREDLLAMTIDADAYAIRLADLTSVHRDRHTLPLPGSATALLGITSVRGVLIPVYDLRIELGYAASAVARWQVIVRGAEQLAFAFDGFEGCVRARVERPTGAMARSLPAHLLGLAGEDASLRVLDVTSMLRSITERAASRKANGASR